MRALASPASLKGVLSAVEAALALAAGMRAGGLEAEELPVADGGEGTAEVLAAALGGEWRTAAVSRSARPAGRGALLVLEDGTAVVEAAEAIGLRRLAEDERDPLRASSRGLGELLLAAAAEASGPILVGLGDTATVDGGAGSAARSSATARRPRARRRSATCATRCSASAAPRAPSGRRRARRPSRSTSSRRGSRRWTSFAPTQTCPAQARPAGSAPRSPRSAASSCSGAELVLELLGFRDARDAAPTSSSPARGRSTARPRGQGAGEVVRLCARGRRPLRRLRRPRREALPGSRCTR